MNFQVTTQALRSAGTRLQGLSSDVPSADTYAATYLHVDRAHSGIFQNAVDVNDNAREALDGLFEKLQRTLHDCAVELRETAKLYDDTDHQVLVALDQHYQEVQVAPGDDYGSHASSPTDEIPEDPGDYQPPAGIPAPDPAPSPGGGGSSW